MGLRHLRLKFPDYSSGMVAPRRRAVRVAGLRDSRARRFIDHADLSTIRRAGRSRFGRLRRQTNGSNWASMRRSCSEKPQAIG